MFNVLSRALSTSTVARTRRSDGETIGRDLNLDSGTTSTELLKVDNDLAGLTWYRIVQLPIQPHGLISWSNFAQTPLHVVVTVVPVYGRE